MRLVLLLVAIAAVRAQPAPAPAAPTWACGTQRDYYAKVSTLCASGDCNAAQRNLGGSILVLDRQSYGTKGCQGCNPDIPATCCQACKDMDHCNAWVVCTNKDGCGSGCQAYARMFKSRVPFSYADKLPHIFWGNWGGCDGDKWPFGMCSLKVVADTKNPPVTSTQASDGWVSGIVPKTAADPKCPSYMSVKTCKACLGTKNPEACISCIGQANRLDALRQCVTCASLPSQTGREACVKCAAAKDASACSPCLEADCSDADCLNKRMQDPASAPNFGAVDACFNCEVGAGPGTAKAAVCPKCFEAWNVPTANRGACLGCISASGQEVAAGCPGCNGGTVGDKAKCQECVKRSKSAADAAGCGSCSDTNVVPAGYAPACYDCVHSASDDDAKRLCSNLDRDTTKEAVAAYYKCLSTAKGSDGANNCIMCYRTGSLDAANKCYECLGKVQAANGIHCSHCWAPSRMAPSSGGQSPAAACESCLVSKDKSGGQGNDCWM